MQVEVYSDKAVCSFQFNFGYFALHQGYKCWEAKYLKKAIAVFFILIIVGLMSRLKYNMNDKSKYLSNKL